MNKKVISIDTHIDLQRRVTYAINWQVQDFCNFDCSYCISHDNSKKSPELNRCIKSIDFALAYADLVVSTKRKFEKSVTFNFLGGEPLLHPNIVELLTYVKQKYQELYAHRWKLTVAVITNGSMGQNNLKRCLPLVDFWMISYHTEALPAQKQQVLTTIYTLKEEQCNYNVKLMMHSGEEQFNECVELSKKFDQDDVQYALKVIGHSIGNEAPPWHIKKVNEIHSYTDQQTEFLIDYWKRIHPQKSSFTDFVKDGDRNVVTSTGSTCCGDQVLCTNQDRKNPVTHIPLNNFLGWYCSVNWYFLFINQQTEEIYFNESCRVNFDSKIGKIGNLDQAQELLDSLQENINNKTVPVIKCPKSVCGCGLCAPKALELDEFKRIMSMHFETDVLKN